MIASRLFINLSDLSYDLWRVSLSTLFPAKRIWLIITRYCIVGKDESSMSIFSEGLLVDSLLLIGFHLNSSAWLQEFHWLLQYCKSFKCRIFFKLELINRQQIYIIQSGYKVMKQGIISWTKRTKCIRVYVISCLFRLLYDTLNFSWIRTNSQMNYNSEFINNVSVQIIFFYSIYFSRERGQISYFRYSLIIYFRLIE